MYGKGKGKSGAKDGAPGPSLQQRFKEMNAQESLIASKKREIEQKLLDQKRKEDEKAVQKLEEKTKNKPKVNPIRNR